MMIIIMIVMMIMMIVIMTMVIKNDDDDDDRIKIISLNNRALISFHHTNRPLIAFSDDEIRIFLPTCVTGRILF